jgi:hypothetical protein
MSSYYPEDDDSPNTEPIPPNPEEMYQAAQAAVRTPALLLILTGILTLLGSVISLVAVLMLPDYIEKQIHAIQQNPNLTQEQKDAQVEIYTNLKQSIEHPINLPLQVVDVFLAILILVGGIQLWNLSGIALPVTASILAMIPCISGCCCLLGLPAGIWALVVLSRPEVKTAIAWRRSGGYPLSGSNPVSEV